MEAIVHVSRRPEDIQALEKQVAQVHARAVVRYITGLSCPKEQKRKLLQQIILHRKG